MFSKSLNIFPGRGLSRNAQQRECNAMRRIFPGEFHFSPSQVTRRLTSVLKSGLPRSINQEGRDSVSGKSLRIGNITEIDIHPFSSNEDVCAMSGHKNGNNSDNYKDTYSCRRSYRSAKIWAEHTNMHLPVIIPKPYMLGDRKLKPMFDKIYLVALGACEVAEFEEGGRLYAFGQNLFSLHLMWYRDIRERFCPKALSLPPSSNSATSHAPRATW